MRLEGPEDVFELRLLGYESPMEREWWAANWLVVEVRARLGTRAWEARSSALLTVDVAALAAWLAGIAAADEVPSEIDFMEPCLVFSLGADPAGARELRIDVSHELSPPWLDEWDRLGDGVRLRVPLDAAMLLKASESLTAALTRFPPRGERSGAGIQGPAL